MTWNPMRVETLKRLWAENKTAAEIGDEIGVSRNAVVAKAHRVGLKGRGEENVEQRLERMVEIITDAPLGAPITVKEAARKVGVAYQVAAAHWRKVWTDQGIHPLDVGEGLVERAS